MATITTIRNKAGLTYRAQIRRFEGGALVYSEAKTFPKKALAERWAAIREAQLTPEEISRSNANVITVGDLVEKYEAHFCATAGRTKKADIAKLRNYDLARLPIYGLTSEVLINHARDRLKAAKPQTIQNDFVWLKQVYAAAYPAWGIKIDTSEIDAALTFCRAKGLVHRADRRERRPTPGELARLSEYFQSRDGRATIPMHDIMWFAVHSARRQAEITNLRRSDNDKEKQTGVVRDIKHPRKKGVHRRFKYTPEAWAIVERQPDGDLIFPYDPRSIGAAFTRACNVLEIHDLRFHDLRHEATSRLFEAGYSITEVQLFTLHESWDVLKRYTNLRPEDVKTR